MDANFGGWAGLTDHGQGGLYRFIDVQEGDLDGPVLDYDVWLAGEPNNVVHNLPNGPEDEDCVLFVPAGFNDALCSFESPFFCEPLP